MGTSPDDFVHSVKRLVAGSLQELVEPLTGPDAARALAPGKMLRTKAAARVACSDAGGAPLDFVQRACAAAELLHTASLCHDDVIDSALIRRSSPALWRQVGPTQAILIGDLLLARAFELIAQTNRQCMEAFAAKTREVAMAEAEQELVFAGRDADEETCLRLARLKTGPLFAFVLWSCGGPGGVPRAPLEEAGYRIGTAYQLADDLLDKVGDEAAAGKSLGTDALLGKPTLLNASPESAASVRRHISRLCGAALEVVSPWDSAHAALTDFLVQDLQPVFERCLPGLDVLAETASHKA